MATGTRQSLGLGNDEASIGNFDGSLVLTGESNLGIGFLAKAIIFDDPVTGLTGRAVWTDDRGDQLFSSIQHPAHAKLISGTFTGGTGRYAGATGTYEFSWRFQIPSDDGTIDGQSEGFKGRVHVGL